MRKTITVAVTGTLPGATEANTVTSDATVPVTQTPAFLGADGEPTTAGASRKSPLVLTSTAGDAFSYTFRAQGFPEPTVQPLLVQPGRRRLRRRVPRESDPEEQLPDEPTFDASTGELSGTATLAMDSEFAVTATSGTESVTQYVSMTVEAAAPVGVMVYTTDRAGLFDESDDDDTERTSWIIEPDGRVYTLGEEDFTVGGRPTVKQGGTLVIQGGARRPVRQPHRWLRRRDPGDARRDLGRRQRRDRRPTPTSVTSAWSTSRSRTRRSTT